jgi:hypothetical protein
MHVQGIADTNFGRFQRRNRFARWRRFLSHLRPAGSGRDIAFAEIPVQPTLDQQLALMSALDNMATFEQQLAIAIIKWMSEWFTHLDIADSNLYKTALFIHRHDLSPACFWLFW